MHRTPIPTRRRLATALAGLAFTGLSVVGFAGTATAAPTAPGLPPGGGFDVCLLAPQACPITPVGPGVIVDPVHPDPILPPIGPLDPVLDPGPRDPVIDPGPGDDPVTEPWHDDPPPTTEPPTTTEPWHDDPATVPEEETVVHTTTVVVDASIVAQPTFTG